MRTLDPKPTFDFDPPNGEKAPIAEKGIGGLIERDTIAMADLMQVADLMKLNGRVFLKSRLQNYLERLS